jgi:hypothetical protein
MSCLSGYQTDTNAASSPVALKFKQNKIYLLKRSEVLVKVNIKIMGFWDVTPCSFVDRYQRFGRSYCPYLQDTPRDWYLSQEPISSFTGLSCFEIKSLRPNSLYMLFALSVVYLTTLSVTQTIQRRVIG